MKIKIAFFILLSIVTNVAFSDNVSIQFAKLHKQVDGWNISVTLKHKDSGWSHYANSWQVVDEKNNLLGKRVLVHPHVNEQPFTRSLYSVKIPVNVKVIYIEATDLVHGLSNDRLRIDLSKPSSKRYKIDS